jgi:flavin-dependent dehydrogenase
MGLRETIAIVGGGPAGTAAAIWLARSGATVTLFERLPAAIRKPGEIISQDVRFPLADLGLNDEYCRQFPSRVIGRVSAWGRELIELDATLDELGGAALVDRIAFEEFLFDAASAAGVTVLREVQRLAVDFKPDGAELRWQCGERLRTLKSCLVIEATGRGRGVTGFNSRRKFDRLVGLLAYPTLFDRSAFGLNFLIEAVPEGWWYSAQLPGSHAVIAFMTDTDLLPIGREAQWNFFRRQMRLAPRTNQRFRTISQHSLSLLVAPANTSARELVAGNGWVAIGDAAASYDPVAGTGIATAMAKGVGLARLIFNEPHLSNAVVTYADAERRALNDFLAQRRSIYAQSRWSDEPFWQRRARPAIAADVLRVGHLSYAGS